MIIYLGQTSPIGSSGTPTTRSVAGTALHAGKGLVVAPQALTWIRPTHADVWTGSLGLAPSVVSVVTSILADDRRYLLPIFLHKQGSMFGLSSP